MGLLGSNATTAQRPSDGSLSDLLAYSPTSCATSVLLPAPGEPVKPITRLGRRFFASLRTVFPSCSRERSRASCAVGFVVSTFSACLCTTLRTALTISISPVPVGKQRSTPASLSFWMSSAGRIPPMWTGMSLRPQFLSSEISLGPSTRCELLIIDAAMTSTSSSRAEIAKLAGVCQSPE